MKIEPKFEGKTAIVLGTGPSMNNEVVELVNHYRAKPDSPFRVFGINNVFQLKVRLDVFFACNPEWWDFYHTEPKIRYLRDNADLWTWDFETAHQYALNWIPGKWSGGRRNVTSLSTDPSYIHYGHGAGYEVLGVAYHYGCRHFILAGYDLRYPTEYDRQTQNPGGKRHFFGEYPEALKHWPKVGRRGEMTGLLDCYKTIDIDKLGLRITNTTPRSALDFFEVGELEKVLHASYTTHLSLD